MSNYPADSENYLSNNTIVSMRTCLGTQEGKTFTVAGMPSDDDRWGSDREKVAPDGMVFISIAGTGGEEQSVILTPRAARLYARLICEKADQIECQ